MVDLDDAIVARLESHGERFEVLLDPKAMDLIKQGKDVDLADYLAVEDVFKDSVGVEVVFDRGFVMPRYKDEMFDTGRLRLFDRVLNQRFVDDGQHFLRHGFGGGQKTGAEPGDGKNGFANANGHIGTSGKRTVTLL